MKKGGIGGAHTATGLKFEEKAGILTKIRSLPGYTVEDNRIYFNGKLLALSYPQTKIYTEFLKEKGIDYKDYISKQYRPDGALFVPEKNTFYIIEMKFQNVGGSVDEKLQTSDFKKKIYTKLFSKLKIHVEYMFILNDFFDDPRLEDTYLYIKDSGCSYYFEELPLSAIDFPEPIVLSGEYNPEDVNVSE